MSLLTTSPCCLVLMALMGSSSPRPTVLGVHVAVRGPGDNIAAIGAALEAEAGAPVTLYAVAEVLEGGQKRLITTATALRRGRRRLPDELLRPPKPHEKEPRWFKVEPGLLWYHDRAFPLQWRRTPWDRGWTRRAEVHTTVLPDSFPEHETGLGVMRYQATWGERASPGPVPEGLLRLAPGVARVTFLPRLDGWTRELFALLGTSYIWGNLPYHADDQYGSDCADFVVAAWRRAGRRINYTNTWGLRRRARRETTVDGFDGQGFYLDRSGDRIPFAEDGVRPGDLVYWNRHVGVLMKDSCTGAPDDLLRECKGNGWLDQGDLVFHTEYKPPTIEGIDAAYGTPLSILRPRL